MLSAPFYVYLPEGSFATQSPSTYFYIPESLSLRPAADKHTASVTAEQTVLNLCCCEHLL